MKQKRIYIRLLFGLYVFLFIILALPSTIGIAEDVNNSSYITKAVDPDTSNSYIGQLISDELGSKNAGRIWTDKSVFNTDNGPKKLEKETDGINANVTASDGFLHEYSLLSSSQIINEEAPLDVMFVIDVSLSMGEMGGIYRVKNALNRSINQLLEDNSDARFGIAVFSSKGTVVLNLGNYRPITENGEIVAVGDYPNTSQTFFYLEFNYFDLDENKEKKVKVSNYDATPEILPEAWEKVITNDLGDADFIIDGGETNIQSGLKAGLEELAKQKDTIVDSLLPNRKISRIPAMILLTDGAANTMADLSEITTIEEGEGKTGLEHFYDCDGAKGNAYFDFTTFDINKDLGHANNYFNLYKEESNEDFTSATISLLSEGKRSVFPNSEYETREPLILNTLLTASYYTAAVNKTYKQNAEKNNATNLNKVELQNYAIYAATESNYSSKDEFWYVAQKIINPEENFNNEPYVPVENPPKMQTRNVAYNMYRQWLEEGESKVSQKIYTTYYVADYSWTITYPFFIALYSYDLSERSIQYYYDALAQYDPEKDGDYAEFENDLYFYCLNEYSRDHLGYPTDIRTELNVSLSDEWFNQHNPYNISKIDLKNNINYVSSENSRTITSNEIENTFEEIIQKLTSNAFLSVNGSNSLGIENSVTYMDPIGTYMDLNEQVIITSKDGDKLSDSSLALLLFGEVFPYSKAVIYDYSFNNIFAAHQRQIDPNYGSFKDGWYDNDDPLFATYRGTDGDHWKDGWTYRIRFDKCADFVPGLNLTDESNSSDSISAKQIGTKYIFYLPEVSNEELNSWRINPAYLSSISKVLEQDYDSETGILNSDLQDYFTTLDNNGLPTPDGIYRLSDIRIWIEETGDYQDEENPDVIIETGYDRALYFNIPADMIPTQIVELSVSENIQNNIKYSTNLDNKVESTPLRLFYSIGIDDRIKYLNGSGIDLTKVDGDYINNHTINEEVSFLSNYYSATSYDHYINEGSRTRGDPFTTFSPGIQNNYYVYQSYHILYGELYRVINNSLERITDEFEEYSEREITTQPYNSYAEAIFDIRDGKLKEGELVVFNSETIRAIKNDSYYFLITDYYIHDENNQARPASFITKRQGAILALDSFEKTVRNDLLCWYNPYDSNSEIFDYDAFNEENAPKNYAIATRPGGIRIGDMAQHIALKGSNLGLDYTEANVTQTANNYFIPTIGDNTGTNNEILINIYLGNNGIIKINNSTLFTTKLVANTKGELTNSNEPMSYKDFDYQVYIENFEGPKNAIKVQWDDYYKLWRKRIATIDALTSNYSFLQDSKHNLIIVDENGTILSTADQKNSSGKLYYVYIEDSNNESADNPYVSRVYCSADYDGDQAVSGSRVVEETGVYFKIDKVYLIPIDENGLDNGTWKFYENVYKYLNDFTIAALKPHSYDGRTDGMDMTSDFAIRYSYLTVSLNFGIDSENQYSLGFRSPTELFDNYSFDDKENHKIINTSTLKKNTAQFTLKHGEGLLFNTIPVGSYFRVTEKLTDNDDPGWRLWDNNQELTEESVNSKLQVAVKNVKLDTSVVYNDQGQVTGVFENESQKILTDDLDSLNNSSFKTIEEDGKEVGHTYSIFGLTEISESGVQYLNTSDVDDFIISKELDHQDNTKINDFDKNTVFNFDLTLSYPPDFVQTIDNNVRYKYEIYDRVITTKVDGNTDEELIFNKTGYLVSNQNQAINNPDNILIKNSDIQHLTLSWPIEINSNQVFIIRDLLFDTEYTLKENLQYVGFSERSDKFTGAEQIIHTGRIRNDLDMNRIFVTNVKLNPESTLVDLTGTKYIVGGTKEVSDSGSLPSIDKDQFSFVITPDENNPLEDPISEVTTVTNEKGGKINFFEKLEYGHIGEYVYEIEEEEPTDPIHYEKDPTKYKVIVTVKEDYGNDISNPLYTKQLKATTILYKITSSNTEIESSNIEFINKYTPSPVEITIEGNKIFKDYKGENISLENNRFNFVLNTRDSTPKPEITTVSNDEIGNFKFGPITLTATGTYNYIIYEDTTNRNQNIIYDPTTYYVRVTVTDENGQLIATPVIHYEDASGDESNEIQFINSQKTGDIIIKKFVQDHLTDEAFNFNLELSDSSINGTIGEVVFEEGKALISLKDGEEAVISNLPIGIRYTITEAESGEYFPIYSPSNSGVIQENSSYNTIEITNRKLQPEIVTINGLKNLITDETGKSLQDGEFNFILRPNEHNPSGDPIPVGGEIKESNDSNGNFEFELYFTQTGVYRYTLLEDISNEQNGYSYDSNSYIIVITVTNDGVNDTLNITKEITRVTQGSNVINISEPIEFNNIYDPQTTSFVIGGKKIFENGRLYGNDFQFKLTPLGNYNPLKEPINVWNDATGYFSFNAIDFDDIGEYQYKLEEIEGSLSYIDYDPTVYLITITVEDNDGQLVASATTSKFINNESFENFNNFDDLTKDEVEFASFDSIQFLNYREIGNLKILKVVDGTVADRELDFEFQVVLYNDEALEEVATQINGVYGDLTFINGVSSFKLQDGHSKEAKNLPAGIYYKVEEIDQSEIFETSYKEGQTGIIPNSDDDKEAVVTVTNTRTVLIPVSYSLGVLKVVENNNDCHDIFEFTLELQDKNSENILLPEKTTITQEGPGKAYFDPITFTNAGTYNFKVKEIIDDSKTYIADKEFDTVEITVKEGNSKRLYISSYIVNGDPKNTQVAFINTYFDPVNTFIIGKKRLENKDNGKLKDLSDQEYKFLLEPDINNNKDYDPVKEAIYLFNDDKGFIKSSELTYSHPGNYIYYLTEFEDLENYPNYIFDNNKFRIVINVEANSITKKLEVEQTITKITGSENYSINNIERSNIEFTNQYSTENALINIGGGKKEFINGQLKGDDFTFKLEAITPDAPMPENDITKNNSLGNFNFETISFTKPGEFKYKVTEVRDYEQSNIIYSDYVYEVVVTVTEDNDKLEAQVEYYLYNEKVDSMVFTNINIAQTGNLEISKKVFGLNTDLNRRFGFTISIYDDPELTELATEIDGKYGDLVFSEGESDFTLMDGETIRVNNLPAGIFYQILENEDKDFITHGYRNSGVISDNNSIEVIFTNIYKNFESVTYTPTIEKALTGYRSLNKDIFTFELSESISNPEGCIIPSDTTTTVIGEGIASFNEVQFYLPGRYSFVIKEINIPDYYRALNEEVTLNIEVLLDENNWKLYIGEVSYGPRNYSSRITNAYLEPVETTIKGSKKLVDSQLNSLELNGEDFTFILEPNPNNPAGDPVTESTNYITNDVNGIFEYKYLYSRPGHYFYTLSEVPNNSNYLYDSSSYIIEVDVLVDAINNKLILDQKVIKDDQEIDPNSIEFNNIYDPNINSVIIEGTKILENSNLKGNDFKFVLESINLESEIEEEQSSVYIEATNDINGHFNFDTLVFDKPGTYKYRVYELNSNNPYILYSDSTYEVTIVVSKDPLTHNLVDKVYYRLNDHIVDSIEFINQERTGNLLISKIVSGNDGDKTRYFNFQITLTDTSINGNYGDMIFENGTALFKLKDNESKIIQNLPFNIGYTISEIDSEDYEVISFINDSTITGDNVISGMIDEAENQVIFNNRRDSFGNLSISKTIEDENKDINQEFDFTVVLYKDQYYSQIATDINSTYDEIKFINGITSFKLKDQQSLLIQGIPAGLYYVVQETNSIGYISKGSNDSGRIIKDTTINVDFINKRAEITPLTYFIEVQKKIIGNPNSKETFTFDLSLMNNNSDGVILPADVTTTLKGEGKSYFKKITFTKAGIFVFKVSEINIPDNYEVDKSGHTITIVVEENNGKLVLSNKIVDQENSELIFTNIYQNNDTYLSSPNVGIVQLHAKSAKAYHNNLNEVSKGESIWYLLRIVNKGNTTAHNLVISDPIPEKLSLTGSGYVTRGEDPKKDSRTPINLMAYYNSKQRLLMISSIDDKEIDLAPNESINIEFEVKVPTELENETYWSNHAWFSYDEINDEDNANNLNVQKASILSLNYNLDYEDLINFDKIDKHLELKLESLRPEFIHYHSNLHNLLPREIEENTHVKYAFDILEHYNIETNNPYDSNSINNDEATEIPTNIDESEPKNLEDELEEEPKDTSNELPDTDLDYSNEDNKTAEIPEKTDDSKLRYSWNLKELYDEPEEKPNNVSDGIPNTYLNISNNNDEFNIPNSGQPLNNLNNIIYENIVNLVDNSIVTAPDSEAPNTGVKNWLVILAILIILAFTVLYINYRNARKKK